jgi:hypothetical protein
MWKSQKLSTVDFDAVTHCKQIYPHKCTLKNYYRCVSHSHTITPSSVPVTEVLIKPVE